MDIVLIAGLWLPTPIWDDVVAELDDLGHRATPVLLPGVDDRSTSATLDDQLGAVLASVDAGTRPLVVGHSAASTLAWIVADRRPDLVSGVAMIGGFPNVHGSSYAEFFPIVDGVMAFPGWEPFEGPDSDDLGEQTRVIESMAVPVPEGVATGEVRFTDDRRFDVPVALICPEYTADQARDWLAAGEIPELERARHVSLVDIDSGHWPMVTRPGELARIIHDIAKGGVMGYTVTELNGLTWDAFAELVERNNGIFGGCWCIGYHPECGQPGVDHRTVKEERVRGGRAHAALVLGDDGNAQGGVSTAASRSSPTSSTAAATTRTHRRFRTGGSPASTSTAKHRGEGIARTALEGALAQIAERGGGLVEAIPEVTAGREAPGRFLFSTTVELFEQYGFRRVRQVGKHAWIVTKHMEPPTVTHQRRVAVVTCIDLTGK